MSQKSKAPTLNWVAVKELNLGYQSKILNISPVKACCNEAEVLTPTSEPGR